MSTVRDRRQGGAGVPWSILPLGGSIELQLLSRGSLSLTLNLCNTENPLECCLNHLYYFFRLSLHFKIHRGKNSSEVLGKAYQKETYQSDLYTDFKIKPSLYFAGSIAIEGVSTVLVHV